MTEWEKEISLFVSDFTAGEIAKDIIVERIKQEIKKAIESSEFFMRETVLKSRGIE